MDKKKYPWIFLMALILAAVGCNFPQPVAPIAPPTASATVAFTPPTVATPTAPVPAPTASPTATPNTVTDAPSPTPAPAYQPFFEPAPCAFPVPAGYSPECGYLAVPQSRSLPDSPYIRLHVAIFRSLSASPAPDPVVHLAGGPGSSSLADARYLFNQGMDGILERRDFILLDQRGTGYSMPRLDCPERETLVPSLLQDGFSQDIVDAFRRCRERLVSEGIDLTSYNSAASAADVNDLRQALGYAQVNLYGVSYGTRLALTLMRDYPGAVRSAVLDSTYPPQVNLYTALAPNAERAFNVLFDRCGADPACSRRYPDLRNTFYRLVDRLNTSPVAVRLIANGAETTAQVDGGLLIDVLFGGMYNPAVTATMPQMIDDISDEEYTILRRRLSLYFDPSSALGMQMSVQCAEEIPFSAPEEAFDAARGVQPQIAAFFPASVQPLFVACRDWNPASPDPRENQPVASDIPTLILAGEYDPITPPAWGGLAAGSLTRAYFFEFPGNGHWVTRSSGCARKMAFAFWEDPAAPPDSSCLASEPGLDFRGR